jgi:signal transduction histidine kinase
VLAARGVALAVGGSRGLGVGVDGEVAERVLTPLLHNAERQAVFEPGRTGGDGDGAGLGLALARRLARAVGGDGEAVAQPGARSARLRVRLPS